MLWLAWRTVIRHPGSVLGALITLVLAATVVGAMWFVVDSDERQRPVVERYAGVPLVVGTGGIAGALPPGLVRALDALPEVARTVPDLTFVAPLSVRGATVSVPGDQYPSPAGHGWGGAALTPFRIERGRPPGAPGEVVMDARLAGAAGVAVGERVEVAVSGVFRPYEVVGVAVAAGAWRHQSALFFTDDHAAELAGRRGGVDAIGVYPAGGVDQESLGRAVGRVLEPYNRRSALPVRVSTGDARGRAEGNVITSSGGGFNTLWFLVYTTGLVAVGMVSAVMGLSLRRRGRELAALRAVGARPGQLRVMLVAEAVLLALVAGAVAVPLGGLLAPVVAGRLREFRVLNAAFEVHYTPLPALWTVLFGVAVALTASMLAVRRAMRIRPGDALAEAPAEGGRLGRGRLITGLATFVLAVALTVVLIGNLVALPEPLGPMIAQLAIMMALVTSVGLVAPWFVLLAGGLLRPAAARAGPTGAFLATANVVFNHRRFAGAVGSLTLGLTLAGAIIGTQFFHDWRAAHRATAEVTADHVLRPSAINNALGEELRRELGDGAVGVRMLPITVLPEGRAPVMMTASLATGDLTRVLSLAVRGGPLGGLEAGQVAMSEELAARHGAGVGSRVRIRLPGAPAEASVTVAAVFAGTTELGQVLLPSAGPLQAEPYAAIYVRGPLGREVSSAAVVSHDRREYVESKARESAERNRVLPYISMLIGVFCLVAAVNSLCLAVVDRRREFGAMRRLGMRRGQVMWMAGWESVLTVLPVVVLSLAAVAALAFVHAVSAGGMASLVSFIPFAWLAPLAGGALLGAAAGSVLVVRAVMRNER
ncbi:ABC transporter permease [Nonomuraea endophytica]|uniref:Putative ABC transport system permease protein n=1 Tax=Nonomuraea endophytica TaxID=714136 RepID=A0A7W8A4K4_9ACTN|nr:ABC transporter permease [Nonomuraea endophytica]MBB5079394.1 putative ABC transport system permease protein [Nonomuraea endophytica]